MTNHWVTFIFFTKGVVLTPVPFKHTLMKLTAKTAPKTATTAQIHQPAFSACLTSLFTCKHASPHVLQITQKTPLTVSLNKSYVRPAVRTALRTINVKSARNLINFSIKVVTANVRLDTSHRNSIPAHVSSTYHQKKPNTFLFLLWYARSCSLSSSLSPSVSIKSHW